MTIPAVQILPHDEAVIDALETIGNPVGYTLAPDGALTALQAGTGDDYIVLYPISGQRSAGSIEDSAGDVELVYQTTIVAQLPNGARWLIDKIEAALFTVTIAGRAVVRVTCDDVGDTRRDDDVEPPVFYATPRWRIHTTTA